VKKWKNKLLKLALKLDDVSDTWKGALRKRIGSDKPLQLIAYRTYGTAHHIYIKGRVLLDKGIVTADDSHNTMSNLLNMYRRFETDEVPGATIYLTMPGEEHRTVTDKEGYFVFSIDPKTAIDTKELYHTLTLQLESAPINFSPVSATAEIMIPPADAEYGIISDIDDTIIRTGATSLLAMGKTVLLSNARTRLPFAGVSEFYKALQLGRNGKRNNPFFYVSSSPWNLYDLLIDFMDHNEIPAGPLLLRDFGIQSESFMSGDYLSHKFKEIAQILSTYPHLNFVLVGDSGEQDPPIYHEVVKQFPGRIIAVYIRDVAPGKKHETAKQMADAVKALGVEMILTEHSVEAAAHASASGLIYREELPVIEQDKKEDEGQAPGKEDAGLNEKT
jgi:phosphatidate phosphatase APP1